MLSFRSDSLLTRFRFTYIPTILPPLLTSLKVLLRERRLPTESIVHLTSILLGSHFRARSTSGLEQDPNLLKRSFEAEGKTLEVALEVWKVYLQVAREEVEEARASLRRGLEDSALLDDEDEEELETDEMPQLISAILRRILPSLRVISKWLKLNITYLSRLASPSGNDQVSSPELGAAISSFWDTYHAFFQSSSKLFILERLPSITRPLEEDLDMRGFAPLQKGKTADIDSFAAGATSAVDSTDVGGDGNGDDGDEGREVHPNEEHLMRLGDIQVDGLLIGQSQGYADPLHTFTAGTFTIPEATEMPNVPRVEEYEREHDLQSISTNTEDDPVNLAMRASLGSESVDEEEEEDEEEVIVWNRYVYSHDAYIMYIADKTTAEGRMRWNTAHTSKSKLSQLTSHLQWSLLLPSTAFSINKAKRRWIFYKISYSQPRLSSTLRPITRLL